MRKLALKAMTIVIGLCIILALPTFVQADGSWSDDFNDGNLDGWSKSDSSSIVQDGMYRGTGPDHTSIAHPSNVSIGSWTFDVVHFGKWKVIAMMVDIVFMGGQGGTASAYGYLLVVWYRYLENLDQFDFQLMKRLEGETTDLAWANGPKGFDMTGALFRFNITRTPGGLMTVRFNGTEIMSVTDTDISTSEDFEISLGRDMAIDNIVVTQASSVDTTAEIPWEYLALGVGGVAVVIIVVLVVLRRR
ncbi:MAG: hypothetical protein ACFFFD_14795 [Promethearchaeota archaeon]